MNKKKNTGFVVLIVILSILVVGLASYIIYDTVIKNQETENDKDNSVVVTATSREDFVEKIKNTEVGLDNAVYSGDDILINLKDEEKTKSYTVNYDKFKYTAISEPFGGSVTDIKLTYNNDPEPRIAHIGGATPGFSGLKVYNLGDDDNSIFIITLYPLALPAVVSTYLIIFDNNGSVWFNGMLDRTTVFIDELVNTLTFTRLAPGFSGVMDCRQKNDSSELFSLKYVYKYEEGNFKKVSEDIVTTDKLPVCE